MNADEITIIEGGAVATVDASGTEHDDGHVVVQGGTILAVGPGPAPAQFRTGRRIDARGCLVTPGLVNTHHHLYQWASRGYAPDEDLFGWLTELYPVWAAMDEQLTHSAATSGLAWLARTGCTTAADHHYVFPRAGGDVFGSIVTAAQRVGVRLHAVRGSMDRGRAQGGLPPDSLVESTEEALRGTEEAIDRFHDPAPDARVRVAVGPCSPFSVSRELMVEGAALARRRGVRLHTHLAETAEEQERCQAEFGSTPAEYAETLGWLGEDVWLAHGVHLSETAVERVAATGTGAAHCPTSNARLGSGIAPVRELLDAHAAVGLGVDGAASNESCGMAEELHKALLLGRLRCGAEALSVRESLWMATAGGARCLGRERELGSLEPGKLADIAVWRLAGMGHAGIPDPVAALVLGPQAPLAVLLVGGEPVVSDAELQTVSETELAAELSTAAGTLADRVEGYR